MHHSDFNAHRHLADAHLNPIQSAIEEATQKASLGRFFVCVTTARTVQVLSEFSASVRSDIAKTVYDTDSGYICTSAK